MRGAADATNDAALPKLAGMLKSSTRVPHTGRARRIMRTLG